MSTVWLSIGTVGMALGTVAFILMGLRAPQGSRYFFVITASITLIAFISYLVMTTGQGSTILTTADGETREFYWARYIDWLLTTPLLLLDLALLALIRPGQSAGLISGIIGLDVLMILTGLGAGFSTNAFLQVVLFLISTAALVAVLYLVVTRLLQAARGRSPAVARVFNTLAGLTVVLWAFYPVVFLLGSEGFGAVGITTEIFVFMVLDLLAKVGFGFLLLTSRDALSDLTGGKMQASRVS
ncbi:MAG: bacteriorhodopsin [Actinomycetota bacterium]|nr:bacteriorhodopsin [Rubrobacteraceae bacterium]MDQ3183577.1 bacteriorhodopsin [Actinomycetota bacterium]MDQ3498454.1 bacteriorhodopsin [Actinomycetota bacterium]